MKRSLIVNWLDSWGRALQHVLAWQPGRAVSVAEFFAGRRKKRRDAQVLIGEKRLLDWLSATRWSRCAGRAAFIGAVYILAGNGLDAQEEGAEAVPAPAGEEDSPQASELEIEVELSLQQAVEMGLARNFNVRAARLESQIRQRQMIIQQAVFDPLLTASANYSKNRRPTASFLDIGEGALQPYAQVNPFETTGISTGLRGRTLLGTSYSLIVNEAGFDRPLAEGRVFGFNPVEEASVRLSATQPLLKGAWYPYNNAGIQIAENNRELAAQDLEAAINTLVFDIESAYWQLVFSTRNIEAKQNSLKVAAENVEKARKEEAAGTQAKIYVVTIEGQHARRKVELNDARLLLENARDDLLELLQYKGESLKKIWEEGGKKGSFEGIRVQPVTEPAGQELVPDRGASLSAAFGQRPDYRRFAVQLETQKKLVELARNERLPRLDVQATWAQFGLDDSFGGSFSSLSSGDFYGWTIGLQFEVPLSSRGLDNSYEMARDRYQQLQWQRLQAENTIIVEVDQSIRLLKSLVRKLEYLQDLVRLKETELDAERRRLAVGASIPFTVNTIENELIDIQTQSLQARTNLEAARAQYFSVTGGLLKRYNIRLDR